MSRLTMHPGVTSRIAALVGIGDISGPVNLTVLRRVVAAVTAVISVGYRMVATVASLLPWLWYPWGREVDLVLLGFLLVGSLVWNVGMLRILWLKLGSTDDVSLRFLAVDSGACVAMFLGIKQLMTPSSAVLLGIVVLAGTVALWTSCRGWRIGLVACLGAAPTAYLATLLSPDPITPSIFTLAVVGHCLVSVSVVVAFHYAFDQGMRIFTAVAYDTGERTERTRSQRLVHDTALQTLESISLMASMATNNDAGKLLARVGEIAATGAGELRLAIAVGDSVTDSSDQTNPDEATVDQSNLLSALDAAVEFGRHHELEVEIVTTEGALPNLKPTVLAAVAGALNEALRNVTKHADSKRVVIRARSVCGGVEVCVRDFGRGLELSEVRESFGWRESIRGRMVQVGGAALLESRAGVGVTVRLYAPAGSLVVGEWGSIAEHADPRSRLVPAAPVRPSVPPQSTMRPATTPLSTPPLSTASRPTAPLPTAPPPATVSGRLASDPRRLAPS
ncbi:MAG: sensor histidine kinase [Nocardioides sp.]